jgi:hypothetical protein
MSGPLVAELDSDADVDADAELDAESDAESDSEPSSDPDSASDPPGSCARSAQAPSVNPTATSHEQSERFTTDRVSTSARSIADVRTRTAVSAPFEDFPRSRCYQERECIASSSRS